MYSPSDNETKRHSRAPLHQLQLAGALGLINLCGCMWLLDQWPLFPPPARTAIYAVGRALALYAWAYLLIPLLRLGAIARLNRGIAQRNALRRYLVDAYAAQGADGSSVLHRKLECAYRYRACVTGTPAAMAAAGAAAMM